MSLGDLADVSVVDGRRVCGWCRRDLAATARPDQAYCSRKHRQAAWRLRQRRAAVVADGRPRRLAYADPPYPGMAARYYGREDTYGGEVDHVALVSFLEKHYDGFALSTSAAALGDVLPLFTRKFRVCAWVKPHPPRPGTHGLHSVWEAVIVVATRRSGPAVPDGLVALPARGEGTLIGRKPQRFVAWLFDALAANPSRDVVDDLFPGTGIVGRSWQSLGGELSPTTWTDIVSAGDRTSVSSLQDRDDAASVASASDAELAA